ncbi:MAG: TetR/AcrR family transcriptional regulator [Gammaproteobacteria bacterium]|jgi:AcrR family transcriptional regulator|nr:TetR/AcrR family transcriptional regulator [Gammaproteobacteria bacterium]MBP6053379.1 TetR/AcrR family transcriptional regulator [Pseudomonadales bacterium]MBK6583490.1 TetR/AcrR family transcriptional regulator [Gammaproteobacteria bacterium]MBK7171120.1 TetR/AcrR family transcriptional regulator [Gammaproteobacteria bacterium]MBK7521829.1 TetR/AcrR family transcriptional regulator [Gammaproteobacteria bacterium]
MKSTAERVLDVAEALFAEKGYKAASLGEVADGVGIRSPSLYNHFRNKEALYEAVLERLLDRFNQPLRELQNGPITRPRIAAWQERLIRMHIANPNLARLLQHEALCGGPCRAMISERLFKPLIASSSSAADAGLAANDGGLLPWIIMGFNNIVMSYVTMAPLYEDLLGIDPLSAQATERQVEFITRLTNTFWNSGLGAEPEKR